jgi:hypothetical protein
VGWLAFKSRAGKVWIQQIALDEVWSALRFRPAELVGR